MSMSLNMLSISTSIAVHDKDDLQTLGSFLLALANTDLAKLGLNGSAKVEYHKKDYRAVFDGGNIVRRPTRRGSRCFREFKCIQSECKERVLVVGEQPRHCVKHDSTKQLTPTLLVGYASNIRTDSLTRLEA